MLDRVGWQWWVWSSSGGGLLLWGRVCPECGGGGVWLRGVWSQGETGCWLLRGVRVGGKDVRRLAVRVFDDGRHDGGTELLRGGGGSKGGELVREGGGVLSGVDPGGGGVGWLTHQLCPSSPRVLSLSLTSAVRGGTQRRYHLHTPSSSSSPSTAACSLQGHRELYRHHHLCPGQLAAVRGGVVAGQTLGRALGREFVG